jgi:putative ABC transport system permease protein
MDLRYRSAGPMAMLKYDLAISWRTIRRDKVPSAIMMTGLAIGYAIFILSFLFSGLMINGDKIHPGSGRTYCVNQVKAAKDKEEIHTTITPAPLSEAFVSEFPEVESAVRFFATGRKTVAFEDRIFYENRILYADRNFLSFFKNKMIQGDKDQALSAPASVVLTRKNAEKYFGKTDPLGRVLKVDDSLELQVTGVVEEPSAFTGLKYGFLISMATARSVYDWTDDWRRDSLMTFVRLAPKQDPSALDKKLPAFLAKHMSGRADSPSRLYLFPMTDLKFKTRNIASYWAIEPIVPLYSFYLMGLFLLIIVGINFMNISTVRFAARAKEIGVRKVVGARRSEIVRQFLRESVLMALAALPFGVCLFEYLLRPAFLALYENEFSFSLWDYPGFIVQMAFLTLAIGVVAGLYPALVLSRLQPAAAIKDKRPSNLGRSGFKRSLIVLQFAFSSILVIFAFIVQQEHRRLMDLDLGFERRNVAYMPLPAEMNEKAALLAEDAKSRSTIRRSCLSAGLPGVWSDEQPVVPEGSGSDDFFRMNVYRVGYDFPEFFGIPIIKGRSFSREFDDQSNIIISGSAARKLGWDDPLGRKLTFGAKAGTIVGVAEDFYLGSTYLKRLPCLLVLDKQAVNFAFFKWDEKADYPRVLADLRSLWGRHQDKIPFVSGTLADLLARNNRGFEKGYQITMAIGLVTVITSAFGLFGLAALTVQGKTKEIGIRKALGDSVGGIVRRILAVFLKLVVLANLIAWPLTYILGKKFLLFMNPDDPGSIGVAVFILTALMTLAAAFAAVYHQAAKAGRVDPAQTLRNE